MALKQSATIAAAATDQELDLDEDIELSVHLSEHEYRTWERKHRSGILSPILASDDDSSYGSDDETSDNGRASASSSSGESVESAFSDGALSAGMSRRSSLHEDSASGILFSQMEPLQRSTKLSDGSEFPALSQSIGLTSMDSYAPRIMAQTSGGKSPLQAMQVQSPSESRQMSALGLAQQVKSMSQFTTKTWWHFLYSRYLPVSLIHHVVHKKSSLLREPGIERFPAAVAFIDISGFTKLAENLAAEHGQSASEILNRYISGFFEKMISVILAHGGDIVKFAGDAMQVVWRNYIDPTSATKARQRFARSSTVIKKNLEKLLGDMAQPLHTLVIKAATCVLEIVQTCNNFEPVEGVVLTLHSGISAGILSALVVGGVDGMWEFFVAGPPVQGMGAAAAEAVNGEVILTKDAFELIGAWANGKPTPKDQVLLSEITDHPKQMPLISPSVPGNLEPVLNGFIAPIVRHRVELAETSGVAIAEYRFATIIFAKMVDIDYDSQEALDIMQTAVVIIQESVLKFQGTLLRLLCDDKGTRFKIVFGMPGQVHEDDAVRAVLASLEIVNRMREHDFYCVLGMATGNVYCGEAGCNDRCEYTAVGHHVNLAARLTQAAQRLNKDIVCCHHTYELSRSQSIGFELLNPLTLKGLHEPVVVYQPLGKISRPQLAKSAKVLGLEISQAHSLAHPTIERQPSYMLSRLKRRSIPSGQAVLMDRDLEYQILTGCLNRTINESVVVIEGDMGMGKSRLIAQCISDADALGMQLLIGQVQLMERTVPFGPWKSIFRHLLGLEQLRSREERQAVLFRVLSAELSPMGALLNPIFDVDVEESAFIKQMTENGRSLNARKLLLYILIRVASTARFCIILEDMHWFDDASIALAAQVFHSLPDLIGIISTRSLPKPLPLEVAVLLKMPCVRHIQLRPLTAKGTLELARQILGVHTFHPSIEEVFRSRSGGKPLYVEELARTMLQEGIIECEQNECILSEAHKDKQLLNMIPDNIREWVASRIDRLPAGPLMTLKTLSVLGQEVPQDLLFHAHPSQSDQHRIKADLGVLVAQNFVEISNPEDPTIVPMIMFQNELFKDVAYETMLKQQRTEIHKLAFDHLEHMERTSANASQLYGALVYHAKNARLWYRALKYSELAGRASLSINSLRDAVQYFEQTLELIQKLSIREADRIEACHLNLADAFYKLGLAEQAMEEYRIALSINGMELPKTAKDATRAFVSIFAKHYLKRRTRVIRALTRNRRSYASWNESSGPQLRSSYQQVVLLEKMVQAAMQARDLSMAGYCAFKLVGLCENLETKVQQKHAMLTLSFAYCGYLSYPLKKLSAAPHFAAKSRDLLNEGAYIPEMMRSLIILQLAMTTAAAGEWGTAVFEAKKAKAGFKELGERKKWREATLLVGASLYMHGYFESCQHHFERLFTFAISDADVSLEQSAQRWRAITELCTKGATEAVSLRLGAALESARQMGVEDLDTTVSAEYVEYLRGRRQPIEAVEFLERSRERLFQAPLLMWHEWPVRFHFSSLALLVCEHTASVDDTVYKRSLVCAVEGTKQMRLFSKAFPFAVCMSKLQRGRLAMLSNNAKKANQRWSQAVASGMYFKMTYFVALAVFQMAKYFGRAPFSDADVLEMLAASGVHRAQVHCHEIDFGISNWRTPDVPDDVLFEQTSQFQARRNTFENSKSMSRQDKAKAGTGTGTGKPDETEFSETAKWKLGSFGTT